jgi:hypothetical protein
MKSVQLLLIGLLVLAALVAGQGHAPPFTTGPATANQQPADSDGDGIPDPVDPQTPQPGEDLCPSMAEDPDAADDLDGCPDSDVSVSAAKEEAYTVTVSAAETKTIDIWIHNGNYPADILVHGLAVSTIGACEVTLVPASGDALILFITDEDGDTIDETLFYLLEWNLSLAAGESHYTTRDYEVVCHQLGEHSFEIQVDAVPWPPVEEEDVEDLPNVHKNFPLVTVVADEDRDSDGDGFSDTVEQFMGTLPTTACPATPAADDEEPDAWPTDFDDNQVVDILDIVRLTPPVFGSEPPNPNYSSRKDLTGDGAINILDVAQVAPPAFGSGCQ